MQPLTCFIFLKMSHCAATIQHKDKNNNQSVWSSCASSWAEEAMADKSKATIN